MGGGRLIDQALHGASGRGRVRWQQIEVHPPLIAALELIAILRLHLLVIVLELVLQTGNGIVGLSFEEVRDHLGRLRRQMLMDV